MSTTATDITSHTEYWDSRQHAWLPCGDYGHGLALDHVPATLEQARAEAADAWDKHISNWVREDDAAAASEGWSLELVREVSYRLVWNDADAEYDDEPLATVEIDVVRDDDTGAVIGYELGAVELYQP